MLCIYKLCKFAVSSVQDPSDPDVIESNCASTKDLTAAWRAANPGGRFIKTRADLLTVKPSETEKLFGLFGWSHIAYHDQG